MQAFILAKFLPQIYLILRLLCLCVLCRYGSETVLGETSDPLELFQVDECQDTYLASVSSRCKVRLVAKEGLVAEVG